MTSSRPPITCHVLDTLTGTPAPSIPVHLSLLPSNNLLKKEGARFHACTNSDGRVGSWTAASPTSLEGAFAEAEGDMVWEIRFELGEYWEERGVKAFFPEVKIRFVTEGFKGLGSGEGDEKRRHWHVPLLLGPYSYTTYRGS